MAYVKTNHLEIPKHEDVVIPLPSRDVWYKYVS